MSGFRFSMLKVLSLGLFAAVVTTVLRRNRRATELEAVAPRPVAPTPEPVVAAEPEEAPVAEQVLEPEPELVLEPEPVVEPEPELVLEPEPVVDVYMAPAEPIVAAEPVVIAEPEPTPEPEAAPLFAVEPTLALDPVSDSEPDPGYWHVPPTPPADWSDPTLDERHSA
jgi:hypothetical protein